MLVHLPFQLEVGIESEGRRAKGNWDVWDGGELGERTGTALVVG